MMAADGSERKIILFDWDKINFFIPVNFRVRFNV